MSQSEEPAKPTEPKGKQKLTDFFDHVFLINCAHRPDRLAECQKMFEESDIIDADKVIVTEAIIGDYTGHPAGWGGGNGAWGCLQSHRRIMEDLMHMRDERQAMSWQSALILEDDVFFLEGALEEFNAFIEDLPSDWGQLYLGGQHQRKAKRTDNPNVMLGGSINRTHAYAMHCSYIQQIYHHVSYMQDYHSHKHIDHQLELAHQRADWPVFCPPRWICGQRAGTSNISGKNLPDMTWNP